MTKELYEISQITGVNIIASTGFHKLIFYPENHWLKKITIDEFISILIEEITSGMYVNCDKGLS